MKKVLLFDLDDTLLWDKQSVDKALLKTCVELYTENPEALLASVRKTAPALYSTYPFYEFTQKIGINPFEGLWGTFHDETFSFPVMHEFIGDYQFKTWNTSLNSVGIFDEQMAHEAVE
ncbi:hypothetical protein Q2337_27090, partial [Escherichia coli]|nr:hypothetical protein [Escherichia coli]